MNIVQFAHSTHVHEGYSIYPFETEGDVHYYGLAWGNNNGAEDAFKRNSLFFVSMYDHMYTRGYVEEENGAPMCGCIKHIPIVSRAECTEVDVGQSVTITYNNDTRC